MKPNEYATNEIDKKSIIVFVVVFVSILAFGIGSSVLACSRVSLGSYEGLTVVGGAVFLIYLYAIMAFRAFFRIFPIPEGDIRLGTGNEFVSGMYVLFQLFFFHTLLRNPALPVPMMRLILVAMGARMGRNSFSAGIVHDPLLTEMGNNSLVGESAIVLAHVTEGNHLIYARVKIGRGVTLGTRSIVMPGVVIGDGAIVAANAVVPKGTVIGRNEVWGGVPARKINDLKIAGAEELTAERATQGHDHWSPRSLGRHPGPVPETR